MFDSQEYKVIKMLILGNKERVKDNVELTNTLDNILSKIETIDEVVLPINLTQKEINEVVRLTTSIEDKIKRYTNLPGGTNLLELETIKKEITNEMTYLSSYRDRFLYELEFLDEVFRKEIYSRLLVEINKSTGVSIAQAEKVINNDERYQKIRRDLNQLKIIIGNMKTKYSFFEKALQLIIQSVSVAGKELHNSKLDN
jgi:hypothetical protein